ncbi:MAG: type 4a pilus biogenesis protein PilO [Candidatus Marinimicrobia bacterium]|nr:type 4a pilus biogenesis protein PilO [Candidatus Neomarinimicrobiota bacterium]
MNLKRVGLINIILLLVVLCGWLIFFYFPLNQEINSLNQEIKSLEQQISQVVTVERNCAQVEKRVQLLENDLNQLFQLGNSQKGIENTLEQIQKMAQKYNLDLEYMTPLFINQFSVPENEQKKYFKMSLHSYPIDLYLNGKFIPTGEFLEELSANQEPIHIQSIHLLTDTELPDKLHIEIKLLAYMAKE